MLNESLRSFLHTYPDFLETLKLNRPKLGGATSEEKANNAAVAEGWEACVATIEFMSQPELKDESDQFVQIDKD